MATKTPIRRDPRQVRVVITPEVAAQMKRLYLDGSSIRHVAIATGSSYGSVRTALIGLGVTLRGRGGWRSVRA